MALNQNMENYALSVQEEIKQIIRDLCAIPAPSHHEEKRAEFCKKWFEDNGFENVTIDAALNVLAPVNMTADNKITIYMAHTDTVFPELTPLPFSEDDEFMYSPGVTDDTANLAVLMVCARYYKDNFKGQKDGVLFVANSCEEGLGNLKGSRQIMADFADRTKEFVTIDAGLKALYFTPHAPPCKGEKGLPVANWSYDWFGDEHGKLYFPEGKRPALGEVMELILPHCDPTINLHDFIYLCSGDEVIEELPIDLRGKFF